MKKIVFLVFSFAWINAKCQTSILSVNPLAEQIMLGNYNPQNYFPAVVIDDPHFIVQDIVQQVSADSLHSYLNQLATFYTRNSASDTVSNFIGIGAARRWGYQKFALIGAANNFRLIPSYLQFEDTLICGVLQHREAFAVLPGADTSDKSIVIVEAHIDSRCKDVCDDTCLAQGMEDNGSGTALVIELARVMSKYQFNRTIVFILTIAEEQGLNGANAFAEYVQQKGIEVHALINNDVVGGVFCGHTSSPPSCPGFGEIDSTHVRLFSAGGFNSAQKQFARFVKLQYKEETQSFMNVPTDIIIMAAEDRTGRGGDHIPFRIHGYTAIRMTSSNENGDANTTDTAYHDRQHTSADILGLNTDGDPELDSFFVDFNYLARNTIINGTGLSMAAVGPLTPDLIVSSLGNGLVQVDITDQTQYYEYRIAVRSSTNDWDSVYTFSNQLSDTLHFSLSNNYKFSVASVDSNSIESLFSREVYQYVVGVNGVPDLQNGISLLPVSPNPADEQTIISIESDRNIFSGNALVSITDVLGKEVVRIPIQIKQGISEVLYNHGFHASGTYYVSLLIDEKKIDSGVIVFR